MKYKDGYVYQVAEDYQQILPFAPKRAIKTDFIKFFPDGRLIIKKGYAWDGASCFPDLNSIIKPSLVHDALYQLLRHRHLSPDYKDKADRLLQDMCKKSGMSTWMAWCVYQGVKWGGGSASNPENKKKIKIAK
jgi:hypothetical protein